MAATRKRKSSRTPTKSKKAKAEAEAEAEQVNPTKEEGANGAKEEEAEEDELVKADSKDTHEAAEALLAVSGGDAKVIGDDGAGEFFFSWPAAERAEELFFVWL